MLVSESEPWESSAGQIESVGLGTALQRAAPCFRGTSSLSRPLPLKLFYSLNTYWPHVSPRHQPGSWAQSQPDPLGTQGLMG